MDSEGTQRRRRAQGPKTDLIQRAVADLDPQLADWVDDFVFGRLWGRPGLNENDRMLVAITSLATTRQTDQLRVYL
ncbi:MAG TPA: hypothetical protein VFQ88_10925, partial [Nevskiaceae bacterium]|nr:hypothetical protein [Nevskiaceae bacterium]